MGAEMAADDATNGIWRGRLDRAPDMTIIGTLRDPWGYVLVITGQRDPEGGGYILTARGESEGAYRIPAIDGK